MVYVKEGLDRSLRKNRTTFHSPHLQRIRWERSLCPSSATLIIVPLALLEHWYVTCRGFPVLFCSFLVKLLYFLYFLYFH